MKIFFVCFEYNLLFVSLLLRERSQWQHDFALLIYKFLFFIIIKNKMNIYIVIVKNKN